MGDATPQHARIRSNPAISIGMHLPDSPSFCNTGLNIRSTANFDYAGKFALYSTLPSSLEYMLVAQDKAEVEVFTKESDTRWIPVSEVYAGVEFPPVEPRLA